MKSEKRKAKSEKSIAAFCRGEAVSTASFHTWRTKLAAADSHAAVSGTNSLTEPAGELLHRLDPLQTFG
ncbi:IS66 family insertion sequence element accessory protein TnpA [Pseudoduganella plicata]|uniref:IS66 family insertion sequence element accessory protein TnpA n=1 Tax=Pseudoduganella plicata TaxID=321984 RepID=UPI003FCD3D05